MRQLSFCEDPGRISVRVEYRRTPPRSWASAVAAALLCAAVLGACSDAPIGPADDAYPELLGTTITLKVDVANGTVTAVAPVQRASTNPGPSLALLGTNEVGVTTSNFTRIALNSSLHRVGFDVSLTNRLSGATFVSPTFPRKSPSGNQLMLIPFRISNVIPAGARIWVSPEWNGDGTGAAGLPVTFFNDTDCPAITMGVTVSDCYRWEGFPAPLLPGVTSTRKRVSFDVAAHVWSFEVHMVLAADLVDSVPQRIAFTSDRNGNEEIYVMNADGSGQRNLTNYPSAADRQPAWSPDGRIAFSSNRRGAFEVHVMAGSGGPGDALTKGFSPAWSPDGSMIAFVSERDGQHEIYLRLFKPVKDSRVTYNSAFDDFPSWSPDGSRIVFTSDRDDEDYQLFVVDPNKYANQQRLFSFWLNAWRPAWSPDGSRIAFVSNGSIWVGRADGRLAIDLHQSGESPSWSPDGSRLVFASQRDGNWEIYTMTDKGDDIRRLTYNTWADTDPDWWP